MTEVKPGSRHSASLLRARRKVESLFQAKKYYDAQQLFQSLYSRYISRKKFDEAIDLIYDGTCQFLKEGQMTVAGELSLLLIEGYITSKKSIDSQSLTQINNIINGFGRDGIDFQINFLKKSIKWTASVGENPYGIPKLHHTLAKLYQSKKDYAAAQRHFLRSDANDEHCKMLVEWSDQGFICERDLFIARTTLQYICLENLDGANSVFTQYCAYWSTHGNPLESPLINFIKFLLRVVERDAHPLFEMLRQKYKISLSRDSKFNVYLNKIGEMYFGVKPISNNSIFPFNFSDM